MDVPRAINYTSRLPVGVAGLISPWNLPLYLLTFKLSPAIVTGNTVVCKPSEFTPVTAWMFCKLIQEAGIHFLSSTDDIDCCNDIIIIHVLIVKYVCLVMDMGAWTCIQHWNMFPGN